MVKKKVDARLRTLLENGVKTGQRSLLLLIGDHARDQVVNIHYMLSKASVKTRPSVLWCYKKELGFTSHRQKRMRKIKKDIARGIRSADEAENPFELFIGSTDIRYVYYKETHKILGQTFGMCVLQVKMKDQNSDACTCLPSFSPSPLLVAVEKRRACVRSLTHDRRWQHRYDSSQCNRFPLRFSPRAACSPRFIFSPLRSCSGFSFSDSEPSCSYDRDG